MEQQSRFVHATDLSDTLCDYTGLIRDEEIKAAIAQDLLLIGETTDERRIRQASYELRLSTNVEFLVLAEGANERDAVAKYERPANGIGDRLRIEPGYTVKVYVLEIFNLPTNVVAHVIPVGNVYKLGLSPETTYADPGFDGEFYIILCNYSDRVVELQVGQPIARVEFIKLAKSTRRPHPGSKHTSEPPIWPRRVNRRMADELKRVGVDQLLAELELRDPPHVEHAFVVKEVREQIRVRLTSISDRLDRVERYLAALQVVFYALVAVAIIWSGGYIWSRAPENIRTTVAEETVKWILGLVVIAIPLMFTSVRDKLRFVLLGKDSEAGDVTGRNPGGSSDV